MANQVRLTQQRDGPDLPRMSCVKLAIPLLLCTAFQCAGAAPPEALFQSPPLKKEEGRKDLYGDPLPAGALARMGTMRFWAGRDICSIAFAPDGKTVASNSGGPFGMLAVWEADTGRLLRAWQPPERQLPDGFGWVSDIAFSPDGRSLAASEQEVTVVWEWGTGALSMCLRASEAASISHASRPTAGPLRPARMTARSSSGT